VYGKAINLCVTCDMKIMLNIFSQIHWGSSVSIVFDYGLDD
jgi:hypothetical protein